FGGDQRRAAAKAVLPWRVECRLYEPADAAADHRVRTQPVSQPDTRLELAILCIRGAARHAVNTVEQLRAANLEPARGQQLCQRLYSRVRRIVGENFRVGGLRC